MRTSTHRSASPFAPPSVDTGHPGPPSARNTAAAVPFAFASAETTGSDASSATPSARGVAADFVETHTDRLRARFAGLMKRSASSPDVVRAARHPHLDLPSPRPYRPAASAPVTPGERSDALAIHWDEAGPYINTRLRDRYAERRTAKIVELSGKSGSEAEYQAFRERFVSEPAAALQHIIKVVAEVDAPIEAFGFAVSKLPATREGRAELFAQLSSEGITDSLVRTIASRPRLVRASLKLKRAVYLRLVISGRAVSDRDVIEPRDRAAALKSLGPMSLTNAQLLVDIAFLRLNPATRALALAAVAELWRDDKPATTTLLSDVMVKLNDKIVSQFERRWSPSGDTPRPRATEAIVTSAESLVADVWHAEMLLHCLTNIAQLDPACAARASAAVRREVSRLQRFQASLADQAASPGTP